MPFSHKILVAGNHDVTVFEKMKGCAIELDIRGFHYLCDETVEIEGEVLWFSDDVIIKI
jgi:hypothetical protein